MKRNNVIYPEAFRTAAEWDSTRSVETMRVQLRRQRWPQPMQRQPPIVTPRAVVGVVLFILPCVALFGALVLEWWG